MKEHLKRQIEFSKDALPEEGTKEYENVTNRHRELIKKNPEFKRILDEKFNKATKTLEIQDSNSIGLNMGEELRHFLREFNHRSWNYGHRKMPMMFNIIESFFHLDKGINYWELLEEEDYLISYFHFIDYYTSSNIIFNVDMIKESLQEDLIYNFNVGTDLNGITFKSDEGREFVIAGVSLVRRGNEVTLLFLCGEIVDTSKKTLELKLNPVKSITPGKEKMAESLENAVREAVKLNDNSNLWKVLIGCRFDLETETIDARYVANDEGNFYSIITDDIKGFLRNGDLLDSDSKKAYENSMREIESYNSIFELAKASLILPQYFNEFEDNIIEEEHETKVKEIISNPIKKHKFKDVDSKFKIRTRSLWLIDLNKNFSADKIIIRDDKFKIEKSGYWKGLSLEEFGIDKKGNQITGKTWVNRTESYFSEKLVDLIISKSEKQSEFEGKNAGFIYLMRNPTFHENIFKIGLTTKETKERAKQLSKTSVPDRFYIMNEWSVKDCKKAEAEIHSLLDKFRVDSRREFFEIEMKIAISAIETIIERINKEIE